MANTPNYGLPVPDKAGIQQTEIDKIAQAITLIDAAIKGEINSLGSAAKRNVQATPGDPAAGRVLTVGSFGLGAALVATETALNNYLVPGTYITPSGGLTSLPDGWSQGRHIVVVDGGTSYAVQTITGASANKGRVATRLWDGTAWQSWSEVVKKSVMDAAIAAAIDNLVGGAPGAVDTIYELATALGNDPNFAATIMSALAGKLAKDQNLNDVANKEAARANIGANNASNLTTGTAAENILPSSVYPNVTGSTDTTTSFNDLTSPGWQPAIYKGTNPNGPGDGNFYFVHNIVWTTSITQIAIHYAAPATTIAMRGRYNGTWSAWTKFTTQADLSAALANYAPLSGAVFTGNISAQRVSTYGDTYSYISFLNAARDTEKAYIGIAENPWNDLIAAVGTGDIYLRKGGVNKFRVSSNYNLSYNNLIVTGNAADYGISGAPGSAAYGGVIGWSADHNSYGILGYNNAYSFYGQGTLYNKGNGDFSGTLTAAGAVYSGAAFLNTNGNIVGTAWSGDLSSYLGVTYAKLSGANFTGNVAADLLNSRGRVYANNGAAYLETNGNVYGTVWSGWLSTYLSNTFATPGYVAGNYMPLPSQASGSTETSFPIGHTLLASGIPSTNAATTIFVDSTGKYSVTGGGGTSALAGTYRARGSTGSNVTLFQRTQ